MFCNIHVKNSTKKRDWKQSEMRERENVLVTQQGCFCKYNQRSDNVFILMDGCRDL